MGQRRRDDLRASAATGVDGSTGSRPGLARAGIDGLKRINFVSRSAAILWPAIADLARETASSSLRVLDIACGGGDNAVALRACRPRRSVDRSPRLRCERVRRQPFTPTSNRLGIVRAGFLYARRALTVASNRLRRDYDIPLFASSRRNSGLPSAGLHGQRCKRAVLVCDLQRSWLGYGLAWVGCRLLTRSTIVHVDGPRSVEAAFAVNEISTLAAQIGMDGAVITHHWPQRWLLTWRKY